MEIYFIYIPEYIIQHEFFNLRIDSFSPRFDSVKSIANEDTFINFIIVIIAAASQNISRSFLYDLKRSLAFHCSQKKVFENFSFVAVFIGMLFPHTGIGSHFIQSLKIPLL